jgi:uncharacterized protein YegL
MTSLFFVLALVCLSVRQVASEDCGVCGKKVDLVMVLDISGSIDDTELAQMKAALVNIAKGFVYGPNAANIGLIQYDKLARLLLPLAQGTSLDTVTSFIQQVGNVPGRGGTAISSGVRNGTAQLTLGRTGAYKVLITVTDGRANTLFDGTSCDSANTNTPPRGCAADIAASIAECHAALPGNNEAIFSLGIGDAIGEAELIILADGKREQYTFVDQFVNFQNFVQKIINDVCAALPGPPCTNAPTSAPTPNPTAAPTVPTNAPTAAPTAPTNAPTPAPTAPTNNPTVAPTAPTNAPTAPTNNPTSAPTTPTNAPTPAPTLPTAAPTEAPPSDAPTNPTEAPTTEAPTAPTEAPTTPPPTPPTNAPTETPTFACNCDDGDLCTTDTCDQSTGVCSNTPIVCSQPPGQSNCSLISCNRLNGTCTNITNTCDSGVSVGAIVGGVIGGIAAVALGAGLLLAGAATQGSSAASSGSGLFGTDNGVLNSGIFQNSAESAVNPLSQGEGYYEL